MPNPALDNQALNDTITIADVKQFITDVREKRDDFLTVADRSWREIEKRNKDGRLYGGNDLDRRRRKVRYPLWWSCWKIRQPITFARLPIPVLKDTQGDDPYGRTACVIGERFVRGILKTFDAFSEFSSAVDDFLVTNFGWGRAFYRSEICEEEEKLRLEMIELAPDPAMMPPAPEVGPEGQPMEGGAEAAAPPPEPIQIFVDPATMQEYPEPLFDDIGPYIKTGGMAQVENEEVYFEAGLYCGLYVDPDCRKWNGATRLAYEYQYSYREFVARFGKAALTKLSLSDVDEHKSGKPIVVYEYHDKFLKEVRWFAENSEDFFQPLEMTPGDTSKIDEIKPEKKSEEGEAEEKGEYDNSDLYGLTSFFPNVEPMIMNSSTKDFWPTPEYFHVQDLIDDIHTIVERMVLLTKAIRIRFFYDSSVTQLKSLIGETGEGGGLGIPNLEQALIAGKGTLATLVQYLPVNEMVEGLNNMYVAFDQRLNMFYNITGLSDLIRGQTNPDSDKTFGERQMEGKFALNRIEPFQRKVQEWIKDNYQLLMEMGLKMFSDQSIDLYVTPQTLDPEDKERYTASLDLLRNNKRGRFRVDFETDSTIAVNETWKKSQAVELANTLTKAMESVANVAETQPELAGTELQVLKHLIGEFSDGKLFVDEIQDSIEQVIEKVMAPQEPEFDAEKEKLTVAYQKMTLDDKFRYIELQTDSQLKIATLQQQARHDAVNQQLEQIKLQIAQGAQAADLQLAFGKLQAEITQAQSDLSLRQQEMMRVTQQEAGKAALETFRAQIEARVASQQMSLQQAQQALEAYRVQIESQDAHLSLQERVATEQRLQKESAMQEEAHIIESVARLKEASTPEPEKAAPVTIDKSTTIHLKTEQSKKSKPEKKKKNK